MEEITKMEYKTLADVLEELGVAILIDETMQADEIRFYSKGQLVRMIGVVIEEGT